MILYRPVGVKELQLISATKWREFPPRLFHQPIFYPVLTFAYAEAIAKNWNTKDEASGYAGFVTQFEVDDIFVARYPVQLAGSREDQELWVPADELPEFNQHILGNITVTGAFYGDKFSGVVDPDTGLPTNVKLS